MPTNPNHIRIVIAGGGTGGHIFPGLAIAAALRRLNPAAEILFVGARGKMEMQRVPEAGFNIRGIDIAGFNRSSIFKNFGLPLKLIKSYFQVRKIVKEFQPQVVIGVGGYSSFPVLRLAQALNIPTFIHESNSLPGKSNKLLGKKATKVFVASGGMEKYFPKEKIVVAGNPIREAIVTRSERQEAAAHFGLNPENNTVLVIGGSLGAKSINETIAANIGYFKKHKLQLIWQTGKDFSPDAARFEEEFPNTWTNAFINRMEYAYACADVVIARAGAMTISELQAQGKASILVPYPHAAEDHQTFNAQKLVEQNAAVMIANAEVKTQLMPAIERLLNDEQERLNLEKNISAMAITDADQRIASEILKTISSS